MRRRGDLSMRAFGLLSAISLALGACAAPPAASERQGGAPRRVVSLNLCTDELLLLLAGPGQIASLTHLAGREQEFPLWREARAFPANDGTLVSTATLRPDLVLTMGGGGDRLGIARRMGTRAVDLPFPRTLDDVKRSIRAVAVELGRAREGEILVEAIERLQRSAPPVPIDTIWIGGGGGRAVAADGLEAQWMALGGYRQRAIAGGQLQLEELLVRPPAVMLRSDYRENQYSRSQSWASHPLARTARTGRTVRTDGRRWTCMGPLLIDEIERLRRERGA